MESDTRQHGATITEPPSQEVMSIHAESASTLLYSPLDQDLVQIRLFQITAGNTSDAIVCTFEVVSLDDNPQYEAISYVWGNPADTIDIKLNGHLVPITRSLHSALVAFRRPDEARTVWADAISIHQANLEDKSHQVVLMSRIYRQCSKCLIWLGRSEGLVLEPSDVEQWWTFDPAVTDDFVRRALPDDRTLTLAPIIDRDPDRDMSVPDVPAALNMFQMLAANTTLEDWPRFTRAKLEEGDDRVLCTPCPRWDRARRTVVAIMTHPWWTRIWTMQEAVLPSAATIHIGDIQINLDVILGAITGARRGATQMVTTNRGALWSMCDVTTRLSELSLTGSLHELAKLRFVRDSQKTTPKTGAEIFTQLYLLYGRKTSNPRDAVYGFQSIVPMILGKDELPDYRLSVAECFCRATKQLIAATDFTYMKMMPPKANADLSSDAIESLPSWAYDYAHAERTGFFGQYHAGGRHARHTLRREAPSMLVLPVQAVLKGVITRSSAFGRCHAMMRDKSTFIAQRQQLRRMLIRWHEEFEKIRKQDRGRFWRTIFYGTTILRSMADASKTRVAIPMAEDDYDLADEFMESVYVQSVDAVVQPGTLSNPGPEHTAIIPLLAEIHRNGTAMFSYGAQGLGCGDKNVQEGDVLAVLKSSVVPVVLRPVIDAGTPARCEADPRSEDEVIPSYRFVGPCYVDGMMDGHAIDANTPWTILHLI